MANQKAEATKLTEQRELALVKLLNTGDLTDAEVALFACGRPALLSLRGAVLETYPTFTRCVKVGGVGKHYDGMIFCGGAAAGPLRYELKHSAKTLSAEALRYEPWGGGVQFRQNQIKAAAVQPFLDSAALYRTWFETHVQPFAARHGLPPLTYEDYFKISTDIKRPTGSSPAAQLICALRDTEALQEELQREWLAFEDSWLPAHPLVAAPFTQFVKEIFEEKDLWINISRNGAFLLEGLTVLDVRATGTAQKPKGGTLYTFLVRLAPRSAPEDSREVPIQLKFYWKNGGQGVQNPNFLLVSGGA
jgi:hypothetical protein